MSTPAGKARQRLSPQASEDPLKREAGAVLAVLVLASYWPDRFRDRWVSDEELGACSRDLPHLRASAELRRPTLKRLVRRGLAELAAALPEGIVERRSVGGVAKARDARERVTRLRDRPRPELDDWFTRFGIDRLDPVVRDDFRKQTYGALGSLQSPTGTLEQAVLQLLLDQGQIDAAATLAAQALATSSDAFTSRRSSLALASVELWRYTPAGNARAIELLRPHVSTPGPLLTPEQQGLHVRILLTLVRALGAHEFDQLSHDTNEAREYLEAARRLIQPDDHSARGGLCLAEAILEDQDFMYCIHQGERDEGYAHRDKAELLLVAALNSWSVAQSWGGVREAIHFLLEIPESQQFLDITYAGTHSGFHWLNALRRYWGAAAPHVRWRQVEYCTRLLKYYSSLPLDVPEERLPLSAQASYELVTECMETLRTFSGMPGVQPTPSEALRVLDAQWYLEAQRADKTHA